MTNNLSLFPERISALTAQVNQLQSVVQMRLQDLNEAQNNLMNERNSNIRNRQELESVHAQLLLANNKITSLNASNASNQEILRTQITELTKARDDCQNDRFIQDQNIFKLNEANKQL